MHGDLHDRSERNASYFSELFTILVNNHYYRLFKSHLILMSHEVEILVIDARVPSFF